MTSSSRAPVSTPTSTAPSSRSSTRPRRPSADPPSRSRSDPGLDGQHEQRSPAQGAGQAGDDDRPDLDPGPPPRCPPGRAVGQLVNDPGRIPQALYTADERDDA